MENQIKNTHTHTHVRTHEPDTRLKQYINIGMFIGIILAVCLIGFGVVNQALEFKYKSEFLTAPCQLCKDLNPDQSNCLHGCFTIQNSNLPQLYIDTFNWKDDGGPGEEENN